MLKEIYSAKLEELEKTGGRRFDTIRKKLKGELLQSLVSTSPKTAAKQHRASQSLKLSKALQIVNPLAYQLVNLLLGIAGYYPVILVWRTGFGTAIRFL